MSRHLALALLLGTPTAALAAPSAADLAGSWDAKATANFSTCEKIRVGDVNTMQLVIRVQDGRLIAESLGNQLMGDVYVGTLDGTHLVLSGEMSEKTTKQGLLATKTKTTRVHEATIEVNVKGNTMSGRRVVANEGPCAIIYDFTAKKL